MLHAALEADEADVAAARLRGCGAAGGGGDLGAAHVGQQRAEAGVAAKVVLIAPEGDRVACPAGDHERLALPRDGRREQDAARAVSGIVAHVHDGRARKTVALPELPTTGVPA